MEDKYEVGMKYTCKYGKGGHDCFAECAQLDRMSEKQWRHVVMLRNKKSRDFSKLRTLQRTNY
jgi:predicted HTH domain antitoxin